MRHYVNSKQTAKDLKWWRTLWNISQQTSKNDRSCDTSSNYASFSLGSTVGIQWEDGGLWSHGRVIGRGNHDCGNRLFMIGITKASWRVTRNSKHIKTTPITAEQYLRAQLSKCKTDPMDEILKYFKSKLKKVWQLIAIRKERKTHSWTVTVTHHMAICKNIL